MIGKKIIINKQFSIHSSADEQSEQTSFYEGRILVQSDGPSAGYLSCSIGYVGNTQVKLTRDADIVDFVFSVGNELSIEKVNMDENETGISFDFVSIKGNRFQLGCSRSESTKEQVYATASHIQKVFGNYLTFPCFSHSKEEANVKKKNSKVDPTKTDAEASVKALTPKNSGTKSKPDAAKGEKAI